MPIRTSRAPRVFTGIDAFVDFYPRAVKERNLESCRALGVFYADGTGVPADPVRARELFTRACDGGVAKACNNLGLLYQEKGAYDKAIKDMEAGTGIYDMVYIEQDIIYSYLANDYLVNLTQALVDHPELAQRLDAYNRERRANFSLVAAAVLVHRCGGS